MAALSTEQPTTIRIALANLPFPATPDDAVARSVRAIADAGSLEPVNQPGDRDRFSA